MKCLKFLKFAKKSFEFMKRNRMVKMFVHTTNSLYADLLGIDWNSWNPSSQLQCTKRLQADALKCSSLCQKHRHKCLSHMPELSHSQVTNAAIDASWDEECYQLNWYEQSLCPCPATKCDTRINFMGKMFTRPQTIGQ